MTLKLHNSLAREKQEFTPIDPGHVRLYACGPTVYNYAHIGNARMAVVFDVLSRLLKTLYPKVTYVSNITDVDDKIIKASADTGEPIEAITNKYTKIYNDDMAAIGCAAPDIQPKATRHIGEMIEIISKLIEQGHAYAADGHVLFNVPSFPAYGGLSGRSRDEQIAGARVEVASYKKDPADFVLWKPSSDDEPGWNSPWGFGRPGWHIECSAMAEKHLGLPFDIHGGGADLKFPHHENEIAQSCCAHGETEDLSAFSKFWVHNGFVTVEAEKMSKSIGNVTLVHDLLERGIKGPVIRIALLSAQYRKPLDWSEQTLHQAEKLYEKIIRADEKLAEITADHSPAPQEFTKALLDDLNSPLAFSALNTLLNTINSAVDNDLTPLKGQFTSALSLLGIEIIEEKEIDIPADILALTKERDEAKASKDYARCDAIRDELATKGYGVKDTPQGSVIDKL